ncbi:hypothetical protein [Arcanobacterium phocae]|uniref:hypothetical protein n=1 Tax=Arcanobacterium phocae TaxID=131112 RepID=UPI001C0F0E78|nr:hypothetical protein [Arcanobacterium phocae]
MRIIKYLGLPADVEFVNIDSDRDTELYCQPAMIRYQARRGSQLALKALHYISSFDLNCFGLLRSPNAEDRQKVRELFQHFNEVDECGLGMSKTAKGGKGSSFILGEAMHESLMNDLCAQVKVGILNEIEVLAPLTDGVAVDRVSDITTKLIRPVLARFTQEMRVKYPQIGALPVEVRNLEVWDINERTWVKRPFELINFQGRLVLLVPKKWTWKYLCFKRESFFNVTILGEIQERTTIFRGNEEVRKTKQRLKEENPYSVSLVSDVVLQAFKDREINLFERHKSYVDDVYLFRHLKNKDGDPWNVED